MRAILSRHRRALAALFAASAAALALTGAHQRPRGVPVLVAAHDLRTGTIVGRGDVALREFPAGTVPAGAVRRAEGRVVAGPVSRGEPLTDARFALSTPSGLFPTHDPAAVAVPIRLADAAVARLLHPGDRVDVLAARTDTPIPARTVASSVPIVAVPKPGPDVDEGALIVVQTGREQAASLARAAVDSRLSVTILGP
jgi:Flp pilus assembly protein CpaB